MTTHSPRRLLLIGGATLLAGLLILFPARIAHHWFLSPVVTAAGIDGSIWRGQADVLAAQGLVLQNVQWRWQPLQLLRGRLGYRIEAKLPGGFAETSLAVTAGGRVLLADTVAALPLQNLRGVLPLEGVAGELNLQLEAFELADGRPVSATGQAGIANLLIQPLAMTPVGNFRADIQTVDGTITGSVEDAGGMLDVAATVELRADGSYSLAGQVGATAAAPASVRQQLEFLGSADARGLRPFRIEGAL